MELTLPILQTLAFLALGLGCALPRSRRSVAAWLVLTGVLLLAAPVWPSTMADRQLAISHDFLAYDGLKVRDRTFPIETTQAPGWQWAVLAGAFDLLWGMLLLWRRQSQAPFGLPLLLAVSGCALILCLQKLAAPPTLLAPFDLSLDRVLLPASLAAAVLLAQQVTRAWHLPLYLSLFVTATRLPVAIFGTIATRQELGTHLDVHATTVVATPVRFELLELTPGSHQQLWILIYLPQLVIYPAFYLLSCAGFSFLLRMAIRQRRINLARVATIAILLGPVASLVAQTPTSRPAATWHVNVRTAMAAMSEARPDLLVLLERRGQTFSDRLRDEILDKTDFAKELESDFVLCRAERNDALLATHDIDGLPTLLLFDRQGRCYARCGYRAGGPALFRKHLMSLRELRRRRDRLFEQAEQANGIDRARPLAAALDTLPADVSRDAYRDLIQEIVLLDADERLGLARRFKLQLAYLDHARQLLDLRSRADRLAKKAAWPELRREIDRLLQQPTEVPMPADLRQQALWLRAAAARAMDDDPTFRRDLQAALDAAPDTALGRQLLHLQRQTTSRPTSRER